MKKFNKVGIKLTLEYQSQQCNGWPFMHVKINNQILARFQADENTWTGYLEFDPFCLLYTSDAADE